MRCLTLSLSVTVLAACASSETSRSGRPAAAASATESPGDTRFAQAAATPLSDLNLVRADIPAALSAAQKAPYATPAVVSCEALAGEVQAIDAALGADLDSHPIAANPSLIERGGGAVGDAAVGAVRGAAEGVVPLAYLKGLGQSAGCPAPAAPRK